MQTVHNTSYHAVRCVCTHNHSSFSYSNTHVPTLCYFFLLVRPGSHGAPPAMMSWLCFLVIFSAFSLSTKKIFSLSLYIFFKPLDIPLWATSNLENRCSPVSDSPFFSLTINFRETIVFLRISSLEATEGADLTVTYMTASIADKITEGKCSCVCVFVALKYSVVLCQQKCKRRGTLESNYCSSNFGETIIFF